MNRHKEFFQAGKIIGANRSLGQRFSASIGLSLTLSFVCLAIIPMTFVAVFILNQAAEQIRSQIIRQLESVAQLKTAEIQGWLEQQEAVVAGIIADPVQNQAMVFVLSGEDAETDASPQVLAALQGQLGVHQAFNEFFLYNRSGLILVSTSDAQVGKLVLQQPYFRPSLDGPYIQSPFYEVLTLDLNMVISHPITDSDGNILGVLVGRLSLDQLTEVMLERTGLGETGETYLVSAQSNYLLTASRFEGHPLTLAYHSWGIDEALAGREGFAIYNDYRGLRTIGVYRWLPELRTALLAEINEAEALVPLSRLFSLSALAVFVAASLAIFLGLRITRWIAEPIVALKDIALNVSVGEYNKAAEITRHNEIGQLAEAFNLMTRRLVLSIEALARSRDELEKRVEERTAELQLANEEVRRFAYIVSHDLRGPLVNIKGFAAELQMGLLEIQKLTEPVIASLDEPSQQAVSLILEQDIPEALTFINASVERMDYFVNAVLKLSRLGHLRLQLEALQMTELVEEALKSLQHQMIESQVQVTLNPLADIVADKTAMQQIIGNVLSNAILYLDPVRPGKIDVWSEELAEKIVFHIKDNGCGIADDERAKVFEPFRRAGKQIVAGEGMGLAYVQVLVRRHEGQIWFQSEFGLGTTFSFSISKQLRTRLNHE